MGSERGFTLLELMVAFVIAGLALGVLVHGASGGLRSVAVANRYQEALARAQSRLATVGHGLPLAPSHESGEDGFGFLWTIDITLAAAAVPLRQPADATHGSAGRLALYSAQVGESWIADGRPRHVRLQTERVGALP
jgi:general secretion pathway protein I